MNNVYLMIQIKNKNLICPHAHKHDLYDEFICDIDGEICEQKGCSVLENIQLKAELNKKNSKIEKAINKIRDFENGHLKNVSWKEIHEIEEILNGDDG